jgi:hypothetical protein
MPTRHLNNLINWQYDVPTDAQLREAVARISSATKASPLPRSPKPSSLRTRVAEVSEGWTLLNGIPLKREFVPMARRGGVGLVLGLSLGSLLLGPWGAVLGAGVGGSVGAATCLLRKRR